MSKQIIQKTELLKWINKQLEQAYWDYNRAETMELTTTKACCRGTIAMLHYVKSRWL